jgi:hypothetical protein
MCIYILLVFILLAGVSPSNSVHFYGSEGTLFLDLDKSTLKMISKENQNAGFVDVELR